MAAQERTKKDAIKHIISIIGEVMCIDPEQIKVADNLKELGMDSLDVVEVAIKIENEFDIKLMDDDLEGCKTVQDIINLAMLRICEKYDI